MNERIRELDKQAVDYALSVCDADGVYQGKEYLSVVKEKFAELIVRECIERVREQYIPIRDQTVEGKLSPIHTQLRLRTERESGVIECGVKSVISLEELIQEQTDKWYKEHFGVEE